MGSCIPKFCYMFYLYGPIYFSKSGPFVCWQHLWRLQSFHQLTAAKLLYPFISPAWLYLRRYKIRISLNSTDVITSSINQSSPLLPRFLLECIFPLCGSPIIKGMFSTFKITSSSFSIISFPKSPAKKKNLEFLFSFSSPFPVFTFSFWN